ncbi:MAG: hypothetical protein Fur0037_08050 [Planctomycetota bacterium]
MRAFSPFLLAPAALCLAACSITMDLPQDFLRLEQSGSHYKAVTPDDGRLWVRSFAQDVEGTPDFWATALKNDLVQNRGYELVAEKPVKDGAGHQGRLFEFRAFAGGEKRGYLAAVFAIAGSGWPWSGPRIVLAEFTAPDAVFAERVASVRERIGTLVP